MLPLGAGRGIGMCSARLLAYLGATVHIADINPTDEALARIRQDVPWCVRGRYAVLCSCHRATRKGYRNLGLRKTRRIATALRLSCWGTSWGVNSRGAGKR